MNRSTDSSERLYFQSERFFQDSGGWYFTTRESGDSGPFATRPLAESELLMFLRTQIGLRIDAWDTPGASR